MIFVGKKEARLGGAGLGKGGNLEWKLAYLFFLAFFFAAIEFFTSIGIVTSCAQWPRYRPLTHP
jgi:hypothetical protein